MLKYIIILKEMFKFTVLNSVGPRWLCRCSD